MSEYLGNVAIVIFLMAYLSSLTGDIHRWSKDSDRFLSDLWGAAVRTVMVVFAAVALFIIVGQEADTRNANLHSDIALTRTAPDSDEKVRSDRKKEIQERQAREKRAVEKKEQTATQSMNDFKKAIEGRNK